MDLPDRPANFSDLQRRLRDLRKRRGRYALDSAARAEIDRFGKVLAGNSLELRIFLAAEVQGHPYKSIALDFGISQRHLYRVRRAMIRRLCSSFGTVEISPTASSIEYDIEAARRAHELGDVIRADSQLNSVLEHPVAQDTLVVAFALKAKIDADLGNERDAWHSLAAARQALRADDASGVGALQIAQTESYFAYRGGRYESAIATAEEALKKTRYSSLPRTMRAVARHMIYLAILHQEGGAPELGLAWLDRAEAVLRSLSIVPVSEMTQILIQRAFCLASLADRLDEAKSNADRAMATSEWHGLDLELIWARLAAGWLYASAGNSPRGLPFVRGALASAKGVMLGEQLSRAYLISARVEGTGGSWDNALKYARAAQDAAKTHPWMSAVAAASESQILGLFEDADATIEAASRCIVQYGGLSRSHYLGVPFMARADALWRQGKAAHEDIGLAIEYFERGGTPSDLHNALDLSFRITGNKKHAQLATEIRQQLLAAKIWSKG